MSVEKIRGNFSPLDQFNEGVSGKMKFKDIDDIDWDEN